MEVTMLDRPFRFTVRRLGVGAALVTLVYVFGCQSDEPKPKPTPPGTLIKASEGGSLTSEDGSFKLEIPAGALASDTEISCQVLPEEGWPAEVVKMEPVGDLYECLPEDLVFAKPAKLTSEIPASLVTSLKKEDKYPAVGGFSYTADRGLELFDGSEVAYNLATGAGTFTARVHGLGTTFKAGKVLDGHAYFSLSSEPDRSPLLVEHRSSPAVTNDTDKPLVVDGDDYLCQKPVVHVGNSPSQVEVAPGSSLQFDDDVGWMCVSTGNGVYVEVAEIGIYIKHFPPQEGGACPKDATVAWYYSGGEKTLVCMPGRYAAPYNSGSNLVWLRTIRLHLPKQCGTGADDASPDAPAHDAGVDLGVETGP
jgi:hypothetical protein